MPPPFIQRLKNISLLASLVAIPLSTHAQSWQFKGEGRFFSAPTLAGNSILAGSSAGHLYAIDVQSGQQRWKFSAGKEIATQPCIAGNTAVVGSYDGNYYGVNIKNGLAVWTFKTGGERKNGGKGLWSMQPATDYMEDPYDFFLSAPATDGKSVFFGSSDSSIYALDAATGNLRWKFRTSAPVHGGAAYSNNTVVIGSWDTYVYALDAKTGQLKWKFKTGTDTLYGGVLEGIQARPAIAGGRVFVGARDAKFRAIDLATGKLIWTYDGGNAWISGTAEIDGDHVYVGTSDSYLLLKLDAETGKEIFRNKGGGYIFGAPAVSKDLVAYGDFTGRMYLLNKDSLDVFRTFDTPGRKAHGTSLLDRDQIDFLFLAKGAIPEKYSTTLLVIDKLYALGPITAAPLIAGNTVFVASTDGTVYAIPLPNKR
ncbi:outer membrane protein assembly factor BamB family protein [Chitinophaga rhizosphaerae]|uniref:outer membrane protein assembly factor BamB family protein n=1 Tax=Chitinophaga rhizosphaerae TaxID=1864947 RepID=UPI000F808778|nr:PQQ-binding-like beta-propeller repeat protein [Chitinophaga rhizosphaerae]